MGTLHSSFCPSKHLSLDETNDRKNNNKYNSRKNNFGKSTVISTYDDEVANTMNKHKMIEKEDHRIYIKKENEILDEHAKIQLDDFEWLNVLGEGAFGKVVLVRKKENRKTFFFFYFDENIN